MPHIIVKLWPGRTDEKKSQLLEKLVKDVTDTFDIGEDDVSLEFEEIKPEDWKEQVYIPDILNKWDKLAKKPGAMTNTKRPFQITTDQGEYTPDHHLENILVIPGKTTVVHMYGNTNELPLTMEMAGYDLVCEILNTSPVKYTNHEIIIPGSTGRELHYYEFDPKKDKYLFAHEYAENRSESPCGRIVFQFQKHNELSASIFGYEYEYSTVEVIARYYSP